MSFEFFLRRKSRFTHNIHTPRVDCSLSSPCNFHFMLIRMGKGVRVFGLDGYLWISLQVTENERTGAHCVFLSSRWQYDNVSRVLSPL